MTTFTNQMENLLRDAEEVLAGVPALRFNVRPKLAAAIKEVRRAYGDDKVVPGPLGHKSCVEWRAPTAGAIARTSFNWNCGQWNANLQNAFVVLADALVAVGAPKHAETAFALARQAGTSMDQAEVVVPDLISAGISTANPDAGEDAATREEAERQAARDAEEADRKNKAWRQRIMRNWWWLVPATVVGGATWYFWPAIGAALRVRGMAKRRLDGAVDVFDRRPPSGAQRLLPAPQGQAALAHPPAESYDPSNDPFGGTQEMEPIAGSYHGLSEVMGAAGWSTPAIQEAAPFHPPATPPTGQPNGSFHGLSFVGFTSVPSGQANAGRSSGSSFVGFSEFSGASFVDTDWEPIED